VKRNGNLIAYTNEKVYSDALQITNRRDDKIMTGIFGDTLSFKQENGPDVSLVVNGDESYARYETPAGYSVIYDSELGLYTYATTDDDGSFVSSRIPTSEEPPANLPLHLEESFPVRAAKAEAKIKKRSPPDTAD